MQNEMDVMWQTLLQGDASHITFNLNASTIHVCLTRSCCPRLLLFVGLFLGAKDGAERLSRQI